MTDNSVKTCPQCGQQLRFPENIGGVLMACPSCGNKFHSDFKLGGAQRRVHRKNVLAELFGMPDKVIRRIGRYFTSN